MIEPKAISGFVENLPEQQLIEEKFKEIIRKNYALCGFTPLDTPIIERVEALTAKGADDNEIYGVHRLKGEKEDNTELGLRFDLTVPLARYVAKNEWVLAFPFKRQHVARVYRWERPQKGRYREFYQADVDIIGNGKLPLFADVEILTTIYNSLKELNFGGFVINMNNKKLLQGFLESCNISKIAETIAVIDKKDKVKTIVPMLEELELSSEQIEKILEYIKIAEEKNSSEILEIFANNQNELLQEGLAELSYVFQNLVKLGVSEDSLRINPAISRGLNYYTGTVFETFIAGAESMGSISSGGRYENLCGNFTKNPYPGVGGSIGLSRLIAVLQQLENDAIQPKAKTTSEILVLNMDEELLADCLEIVKTLRNAGIPTEIYLDSSAKMKKQMKYADNKNIKKVLIFGGNEKENGTVMLKNLDGGAQKEISLEKLVSEINL